MKTITIEVPDNCEIKIVEKQQIKLLPKTWEGLSSISGYYVTPIATVRALHGVYVSDHNKNIFPTREEAEASIALAQLLQLRDVYNGDWRPDWTDKVDKHCIMICRNHPIVGALYDVQAALAFQSKELAQQFLKNFKDLIEIAKPLL